MTQTPVSCQAPDSISSKEGSKGDHLLNIPLDAKAVEVAARAVGTARYMHEFSVPNDHPDVVGNVNANWWIFAPDVEFIVRAYLSATLPADVKGLVEVALNAPLPGGAQVWHLIDGGGQQPSDMARTVMRAALSAAFTHLRKEQQS